MAKGIRKELGPFRDRKKAKAKENTVTMSTQRPDILIQTEEKRHE